MTPVIPILLYHSVTDDPPAGDAWGAVSRSEFAAHLDAIAASGRVGLDVSTLAAALRGERPLPARPVAVTFDDGYADTYDAAELLRDRGLPATVYVTTGEIGGDGRMTPARVAALARVPGVELGSHSVRHPRLDELGDRELAEEVEVSKAQLEDVAQGPVRSFAYPHGCHDRRVRQAVIDAGYESAAAVKNAVSHPDDDPFALARWTVTAGTPAARIADVLEGVEVPRAWAGERWRTRAYRIARRQRRRLTPGQRRRSTTGAGVR